MASVGNVSLERRAAELAKPLAQMQLGAKKVHVKKETQRLLKSVPKRILERGAALYPPDFAFLKNRAVKPTAYPALPDTAERRLLAIANLFHTSVLPEDKEEEFFEYMGRIPGIDIVDRREAGDFGKTCDWYVFRNEPWFSRLDKARLFGGGAVEYLKKMGYERIQEPELGSIIVYFHARDSFPENAGKAGHYGRVVEMGKDGEPLIESKFCHFFVYRHRKDLVHSCFGNEYAYMRKILAAENKASSVAH